MVVLAASCGASAAAPKVLGHVGAIEVTDAYLPAPASPSVASVYLTIHNTGDAPDELVAIATPAATSAMLMTDVANGATESMRALPVLYIPAHGEASLSPGRDHAMLENPSAAMVKVGQTVPVTLRFSFAGPLTMQVPVVPLSSVVGGGQSSGGMANMPGM